jgi:hypothetical protein
MEGIEGNPEIPENYSREGTRTGPYRGWDDEPFAVGSSSKSDPSPENKAPLEWLGLKEFLLQKHLRSVVSAYLYVPYIQNKLTQDHIDEFRKVYLSRQQRPLPDEIRKTLELSVTNIELTQYIRKALENYFKEI